MAESRTLPCLRRIAGRRLDDGGVAPQAPQRLDTPEAIDPHKLPGVARGNRDAGDQPAAFLDSVGQLREHKSGQFR